ncbi:DUF1289 domain-containing protein [Sphingomonas sp. LY54]|nr:DUF1289 domain-containing protein [Sphingomonas sp. LY54]WRP30183.1 DUF1289 domain-containing protein [Sphingomonas sp. LY54]
MCVGCGRTLGEIAEWSEAAPARRLAIIAAARDRLTRS